MRERPSLLKKNATHAGNLQLEVTEDDLNDAFALYGDISRVKKVESRKCAFVTFKERKDAETAAESLQNRLVVKGVRLKLMWGRPQERRPDQLDKTQGAAGPSGMPMVRSVLNLQMNPRCQERCALSDWLACLEVGLQQEGFAFLSLLGARGYKINRTSQS